MILESARILTDWWADDQNGVNALIVSTPRDPDDAEPPAVVSITDVTRTDAAALDQTPADLPALVLRVHAGDRIEGQANTVLAECVADVYVRYLTSRTDLALGVQDTLYTLRALLRSTRRLLLDGNAEARTRNQVQLYHAGVLELVQMQFDPRSTDVAFVLHGQFSVRDLLPT